ncbi:PcfB family protein [Bifidobacterium longum]|uniref:PcfB family protein n=1 Tax=Bifidobacterium longum TaxID=216816 RepID=UPI00080BF893|nr:PcfB family protein [Bifidobacterium longum]
MPIEEQAEEKIQNAVQTIITGGAKLMLRIPKGVAMALLRSGMKLAKTGVHAAGETVKNKIDSGEMSEKRLQRKKDGDLHELQLDDSTMREVQHSLKQAGIDYHLERTDQGQFILHFAGRDEDHVRHAVQRAFKGMGLDVADDDFAVEQTEQQERTTERTRNEPETPARETPVEPAAKPMPTQRIAWDFVDPEVMEMAANSLPARHPELSWDRLMGDTTWNEQAGRDFADRIIGKAAADPSLRDELDTILRDDYGQGAQTQEQTRGRTSEPSRETPATEPEREPEPAPDEARAQAERQQTQARADNPRPAGKERKPKPIRSKKALLERFKTRLNENLAEQKNHMPPTQNRDRTPRKGR